MSAPAHPLLLLTVILASGYWARGEPPRITPPLRLGMTFDEVRHIMGGPPQHIARQILYHRCREQWTYGQIHPLRLEFDWRRGQRPRLTAVFGRGKMLIP